MKEEVRTEEVGLRTVKQKVVPFNSKELTSKPSD